MHFPRATAAAIGELELNSLTGIFSIGLSCVGAKFHSPRPLVLHEVLLPGDRTVHLCAVCRDNLQVLNELVNAFDGELPWRVRREFGNQLRALAMNPEETGNA